MLVDLSKVESVKEFVDKTREKICPCYLRHGKYVIDAKSILGIFSLNLSSPVELEVEDGDYSLFAEYASK